MTELLLKGQRELVRAFDRAGPEMKVALRAELAGAVESVRHRAEVLARRDIPRITVPWSRMRVGVTQKLVYVVPAKSGGKGPSTRRRPAFADLMNERAMDPALEQNLGRVERAVGRALERVETDWSL